MSSTQNMMARLSATSLVTIASAMGALVLSAPADAQSLGQYYYAYINGWRARGNEGGPLPFSQGTPPSVYGALTPQTYSVTAANGAASASANDDRGGTVSVAASIAYQEAFPQVTEIHAEAQLTYFFELEGPASDTRIPVLMTALGVTSGTEFARMQLAFKSDQDRNFVGLTTDGEASFFDVNRIFYLEPGNVYQLSLHALASVDSAHFGSDDVLSAGATIDPTFTIQGDFSRDYHFVGLPASAIGGVTAVPEPASWAMMVGGLALIGSAMRRRRTLICFA